MSKKSEVPPPKPVQTLLALALLFQVWGKIKRQDWMVAREVVDANPVIFERIANAITREYNYNVQREHLIEAVVMALKGFNIEVAKRP